MKKLTLKKACELFERDHGDCDNTTCSMIVAYRYGYTKHALDCWVGSGAASDEFKDVKLPWTFKESQDEAEELCKEVPHTSCKHCDAIIWEPEDCGFYCSSCGKTSGAE